MKRNEQAKKKKTQKQRGKFHRRGQRYTQEQQERALEMLRKGEPYSEKYPFQWYNFYDFWNA